MPKVFVNGLNIHYMQAGSGPDMVLLHGLTGSLAAWQWHAVPALASRFRVLTCDLRGHGESDMPASGYTSAVMAEDLRALLDVLGIERAHLVGHSFGGVVALHLAVLHPDQVLGLTISDSRIRALQPAQKCKDWSGWAALKARLEALGIALDEECDLDFSLLDALVFQNPAWSKLARAGDSRRAERWKRLLSTTTARDDLGDVAGLTDDQIRAVRAPVQALYGEISSCLPSLEGLRGLVPNLTATILPGLGHFFPITKPALFAERILAFHRPAAGAAGPDASGPSAVVGSPTEPRPTGEP
jgi:pimeloyl-ACP methyl ester carboxylesterase